MCERDTNFVGEYASSQRLTSLLLAGARKQCSARTMRRLTLPKPHAHTHTQTMATLPKRKLTAVATTTATASKAMKKEEHSVVEDEVEDESTYEKFERGIVEADLAKVEEAIHQEVMEGDHFRWGEDDDDDWVTQLLGCTDPTIRKRSGVKLTSERVELLKSRAESGFLQATLRALFGHGFDFVYDYHEEYGLLPASACAKLVGLPAIEFLLEQMALEQKWRPKCTSVHVKKRHELWEARRKAHEAYDWEEHFRRCEHGGMA